ncbi:Cysteine desulfurase, partial [hydrothermal vent metagenome]
PRLIYLDNGSTSWPKAPSVAHAVAEAVTHPVGNPGRGQHHLAKATGEVTMRLRRLLAERINAPSPERVCLSSGATASMNMALLGLLWFNPRPAGERPIVVTTAIEHNAVRRPLLHQQREGVCDIVEIPCDAEGFVEAEAVVEAAAAGRCVAVVMSACSNVLGTIQPIEAVGRGLRERAPGVLFIVDAAQSMGVLPMDVQAMGVDVLVFSGHKALLGPAGIGGAYLSERAYSTTGVAGEGGPIRPTCFGGTGGTLTGSLEAFNPPAMPGVFEVGTTNTIGQAGLLAALEDEGVPTGEASLAQERRLLGMFFERFGGEERVRILGPRGVDRRHGLVSFNLDGYTAQEVSTLLDTEWGIVTRAGLHCAPGAHRAMGTLEQGAVRVSPGPLTTEAEMGVLLEAVGQLLES